VKAAAWRKGAFDNHSEKDYPTAEVQVTSAFEQQKPLQNQFYSTDCFQVAPRMYSVAQTLLYANYMRCPHEAEHGKAETNSPPE